MKEVDSCTFSHFRKSDKVYERSKEHFDEPNGRCNDCGIKHGGYHHYGCDVERCPICGHQLISCDCFGNEIEILAEMIEQVKVH